jgi:tight adherence protein C
MNPVDAYLPLGLKVESLFAYAVGAITFASVLLTWGALLDLLVICAEAGLSLDAALNRVADEMTASAPALADELALTSVELNFLPERRMALDNFARRADLPAIRGVVNTLIQTEKYGTPLSQSLRVLSAEFREQRMLRAEEKAARLPATLTVPMILFILPTLFIVLVGPAMIDVYDKMTH